MSLPRPQGVLIDDGLAVERWAGRLQPAALGDPEANAAFTALEGAASP